MMSDYEFQLCAECGLKSYHERGHAHCRDCCLTMARYDYSRQVWTDATGAVLPCAHPATMGPDCCEAFRLTGRRAGYVAAITVAARDHVTLTTPSTKE